MTKQMVITGLISMPGMGRAWRHPEVDPGAAIGIGAYKRAAQLCEQGMFDVFFMAGRPGATVSNLLGEVATAFKRGSSAIVSDPVQVADHMQAWFEADACDGFMIGMAYWPGSLEAIVELLVPELQRRGLMRTAYIGNTLLENLGLAKPENRHIADPGLPDHVPPISA